MPDESLRYPLPGGETPDPVQLLQDSLKEFTDDLVPYLMAGLGQMVVTIPLTIIMVFVIYFVMFGTLLGGALVGAIAGAVVGEAAGDEAGGLVFGLIYLLSFVLMFGLIAGLSAMLGALMAPLNASLVRRVARHQRGERVLDFSAAFSDAKENILPTMIVTALVGLVVTVGIMFCYIPGIIAAFLMMYAGTLVFLHRLSPVNAMVTSAKHFTGHFKFHGIYSLLHFAAAMAAAWIPLMGPMFLLALHVRTHRALFGDAETAVIH